MAIDRHRVVPGCIGPSKNELFLVIGVFDQVLAFPSGRMKRSTCYDKGSCGVYLLKATACVWSNISIDRYNGNSAWIMPHPVPRLKR